MQHRRLVGWVAATSAAVVSSVCIFGSTSPAVARDSVATRLAKGEIRVEKVQAGSVTRTLPAISSAVAVTAADARAEESDAASGGEAPIGVAGAGTTPGTLGCSRRDSRGNARVNQDCTFRRQAEELVTFNPTDPNNLVAGQNDSRVGYNQCGIDWSVDNGRHWGDLLPPFRQRQNNPAHEEPTPGDPNRHTLNGGPGTDHTYDAASDPAAAFDSSGNAYFSCIAFDIASNASLVYVTQSPAFAKGSYFHNLAADGRRYIVAEDNSPLVFHDKEFIAADANRNSPNRDNVYITWTAFKFDPRCGAPPDGTPQQCESPIFGAMSTDHGHTWSTPEEVSGTSAALCSFGTLNNPIGSGPNACNQDQGSDPRTLPNGDLQVVFNNGNAASGNNPNSQQLGVHCRPTGSSPAGTAHLNCAAPSKVGNDVSLGEPTCDFGRGPEECVPGPDIRTDDYPRIANAPDGNSNHLYATWQDYRNGEYDIQLSQSLDGGLTWHETGTVNPDRGLDHYFPAVALARVPRDRVGDSYYRSGRVPAENTAPTDGFKPGRDP
ncbi:MAG: hypothetical protein QOJ32_1181, partial [Frankiaceae bacterium]|nr:hypothetical protein [Frankiaceae bacterium]